VLLARPNWTQESVQASADWAETPAAAASAKTKRERGLASIVVGLEKKSWGDDPLLSATINDYITVPTQL